MAQHPSGYAWDSQGRLVNMATGQPDRWMVETNSPIIQPGARWTQPGDIWTNSWGVRDYQPFAETGGIDPQAPKPVATPNFPVAAAPSATLPQPGAGTQISQPGGGAQFSQQQPEEVGYAPFTGEVPSARGLQLGFNPNVGSYSVPERVYGGRGAGRLGPNAQGLPGETFLEEDISPFVPFLV